MWLKILSVALLAMAGVYAEQMHKVFETEMFSIPISPNMFNWTYQEFDQQYRFHASLLGKPELPSWLRYIYSGRHHSGFIFGTPPRGSEPVVTLEVIGLNRQDFETRRLLLKLRVHPKEKMAKHEVAIKIDNLNVDDLLDEHRMTRLKDIFRAKLWMESSGDLYTTFLASAIDLGARLPLKPTEGDGVVIRFGSASPFSEELKRLREEVRPLSRLPSCPRQYKRTTVERLFREESLTLDWCSFELYNTIHTDHEAHLIEYLSQPPHEIQMGSPPDPKRGSNLVKQFHDGHTWEAPMRSRLPQRSYVKEFTLAVVAPVMLMLVFVTALTAVLCVHYAGIAQKPTKVEMCRYEPHSGQSNAGDTATSKSVGASPNNSLTRPYSPKSSTNLAGNYNRPQPPPYMGSNTNSLHHRKNIDSDTETTEPRNMALEESLKLLNDAKLSSFNLNMDAKSILKDPVVDFADGGDDYVPINDGFLDLDDINVPELTKYGLGGNGAVI